MDYQWYDFMGNVGVIMILTTYCLLQFGKIDSQSIIYSLLNMLGALFVLISLCFEFNFSAFIIELFWFLISVAGALRFFRAKVAIRNPS